MGSASTTKQTGKNGLNNRVGSALHEKQLHFYSRLFLPERESPSVSSYVGISDTTVVHTPNTWITNRHAYVKVWSVKNKFAPGGVPFAPGIGRPLAKLVR